MKIIKANRVTIFSTCLVAISLSQLKANTLNSEAGPSVNVLSNAATELSIEELLPIIFSAKRRSGASASLTSDPLTADPLIDPIGHLQENMVLIPAGTYLLGSPESESQRMIHEGPQQTVTIDPFYMGAYEVTFALWDACVSEGGCSYSPTDDDAWGRGLRPVMNVSYTDITTEFIPWLNASTGQTYRLPSESEWEYAVRASTTGRFNTGTLENGDCITSDQANFWGFASPPSGCEGGIVRNQTIEVGSLAPNAWGLYNTHGNVMEWADDCWNDSHTGHPGSNAARTEGDCTKRSVRGGSWFVYGWNARSAARAGSLVGDRSNDLGFRLVMDVPTDPLIDPIGHLQENMLLISANFDLLGSPESESQRMSHEGPQKSVALDSFYIGAYEVTFALWDACVADGGCSVSPADHNWGRGLRPVMNVSYHHITTEFIPWLNTTTGETYRLPSEAEWEYAARAGSTGRFNTGTLGNGDCITVDQANFRGSTPASGCPTGSFREKTLEVGSFAPNAWGLYDTHGNVAEFVGDCWNSSHTSHSGYNLARTDGHCADRVARGGSWGSIGRSLRLASRGSWSTHDPFNHVGFRLVKDLPGDPLTNPVRYLQESMVLIPSGTYLLGSPASEPERVATEGPQQTVTIDAFYMGAFEITFALWDLCVTQGGCSVSPSDLGWGRGLRPVMHVSYTDIKTEFIPWLNARTGQTFRLPSESEWEYAARAGTTGRFNTGNCLTAAQANFWGSSPPSGCATGVIRNQAIEVGSFAANAWGLYDTHGNLWEWTEDCWNDSHTGHPGSNAARTTGDCSIRLARGGSWGFTGRSLRSATRFGTAVNTRDQNLGFRLVRSL